MPTTTPFRLSTKTLANLDRLERKLDKPKRQIVDEALEQYQRRLWFEELNQSWAKMEADPRKFAAYQQGVAEFYGEQDWPEYNG